MADVWVCRQQRLHGFQAIVGALVPGGKNRAIVVAEPNGVLRGAW